MFKTVGTMYNIFDTINVFLRSLLIKICNKVNIFNHIKNYCSSKHSNNSNNTDNNSNNNNSITTVGTQYRRKQSNISDTSSNYHHGLDSKSSNKTKMDLAMGCYLVKIMKH